MARRVEHQAMTALFLGIAFACRDSQAEETTAWPVFGAGLGALFATLPDMIEPAHHPHHRQFFHSVVFAGFLAYLAYKLYKWNPDEPLKRIGKLVALTAVAAYLIHLAMDAQTPRSIPLVGRLA